MTLYEKHVFGSKSKYKREKRWFCDPFHQLSYRISTLLTKLWIIIIVVNMKNMLNSKATNCNYNEVLFDKYLLVFYTSMATYKLIYSKIYILIFSIKKTCTLNVNIFYKIYKRLLKSWFVFWSNSFTAWQICYIWFFYLN